jgi:hypothetical protein
MNQTIPDQAVVLIVARVVPVIQQGTEHGACLPPIIRWVKNTRIASENANAFIFNDCILRNELLSNFRRNILD